MFMYWLSLILVTVGVTIITSVFALILSLVDGFVLMKFWEWFVSPTLGFAPLNFWPAVGIFLTVSLIFSKAAFPDIPPVIDEELKDLPEETKKIIRENKKNVIRNYVRRATIFVLTPIVTLFIGWIVSLFI